MLGQRQLGGMLRSSNPLTFLWKKKFLPKKRKRESVIAHQSRLSALKMDGAKSVTDTIDILKDSGRQAS